MQPVRMPGEDETTAAERSCVARAAPKRQREFLSGRAAARQALARLGRHGHDLLVSPTRAPRWPPEVVGSISHCGAVCLAAVALRTQLSGIGVDCEPDAALDASLWPRICTPTELDWMRSQPEAERGRWARLIFCAKEAAYKYQHPLTQSFVGFQAVSIILEPRTESFRIHSEPRIHVLNEARGSWRRSDGLVVSLVVAAGTSTE